MGQWLAKGLCLVHWWWGVLPYECVILNFIVRPCVERHACHNLKAERDAAKGESTALQSRLADLQASQADFDKRVQIEVARVVASTGTTLPARVTPAGDATQAADLHAQFAAITDPAAQTAFWRKLTPEQQALILKHQA